MRGTLLRWTTALAVLVTAFMVVLSQVAQRETAPAPKACTDAARALDITTAGSSKAVISKTSTWTTYHWGEVMCSVDQKGDFRSIADMRRASDPATGTVTLKTLNDTIDFTNKKLKPFGKSIKTPAHVRPDKPWNDKLIKVYLSYQPEMYGYPTVGFMGGPIVAVNRVSGRVTGLWLRDELKPDKPNIQVTEQQAIDKAKKLWEESDNKRYDRIDAVLQYFRPGGSEVTEQGKKHTEQGRLRLCWVVNFSSQWKDEDGGEFYSPITLTAIDSETGEVLEGL